MTFAMGVCSRCCAMNALPPHLEDNMRNKDVGEVVGHCMEATDGRVVCDGLVKFVGWLQLFVRYPGS